MKKFYTKLLLLPIVACSFLITSAQSRLQDSTALVTFYNNCGGTSWINKTNWLSAQPIDSWFGITVSGDRVQSIVLTNNNLVGNISNLASVLTNNPNLQTINLSNNALTGSFPSTGTGTTGLVTVDMSYNQLTGITATFTGSGAGITNPNGANYGITNGSTTITMANTAGILVGYYVSGNTGIQAYTTVTAINPNVSVTISKAATATATTTCNFYNPQVFYFNNLTTLNFSHNNLSGAVKTIGAAVFPGPDFKQLFPVPNLTNIDFSYNQYTSGTYNALAGAQSVSYNVSHNSITGALPYISNNALVSLDLSYNFFSGSIGFYATNNLVTFKLDHNQLSNTDLNIQVPSSLRTLTLNSNKLSGKITSSFNNVTTAFQIDSNKYNFGFASGTTMENIAGYTAATLTYAPQDTILPLNFNTYVVNKLSVTATGAAAILSRNTYKWYLQDGTLVATTVGDSTYTPVQNGTYYVKVTNSIATALTLTSGNATVSQSYVQYYNKANSDLGVTSSWGTNTDGTGTAPANFSAALQTFNITNTGASVGTSWTVSGTGSSVKLGDAVTANILIIQAGQIFTLGTGVPLTISPGSVLTINATAVANFNAQQVTLQSSATATASIGAVNGTLSGATNVTVERYVPAAGRKGYILVSSPVSSPSIYTAWQEGGASTTGYGTQITGATATAANGFDAASASGYASLFTYNDANAGGSKWVGATTTKATTLGAGKGYLLYVRGDRSEARYSTSNSSNTVLRATGTVTAGNATPALTTSAAGKFNLIANPYPCAIDWTTGITKTNVTDAFWVYDPNTNNFITYNNGVVAPASARVTQYLQSGQAFFVQNAASGTPSVTFTEASKSTLASTATSNTVFGEKVNQPRLNINVYSQRGNLLADGVVATFDKTFAKEVGKEDASKMENFNETFALKSNNKELSIEGRPLVSGNDTLFLSMKNFAKKEYILKVDALNFNNVQAKLEDKYTGAKQPLDMRTTSAYSFTVNGDVASAADRFIIVLTNTAIATAMDINVDNDLFVKLSPNPVSNRLQVNFKTQDAANTAIKIINSLGQVVKSIQTGRVNNGSIQINVSGLAAGTYTVQLINGDKKIATRKIVKN